MSVDLQGTTPYKSFEMEHHVMWPARPTGCLVVAQAPLYSLCQ